MKYTLARASTLIGLETEVNSLCSDGWEPLGAPLCVEDDRLIVQAMVRRDTQPDSKPRKR